jgi:transcriptional regulator with XRE-family HTH domain
MQEVFDFFPICRNFLFTSQSAFFIIGHMIGGATMSAIGDRIQQLLNEKHIKSATFAKQAGVSVSTMNDIIKGTINPMNIGVDKVIRIAEGLGVTVEELYGRQSVVDDDETTLVWLYRDMTADGRRELIKHARLLYGNEEYKKDHFGREDNFVGSVEKDA